MDSEKVKDIKEYLQEELFIATKFEDKIRRISTRDLQKILTLINELESENAELKKYKLDWLNGEKMHLQAELEETEFELASSNRLFEIVSKENKQLKKRIAELEKENAKYKQKLTTNQWVQEIRKEALKQFAEMLKEVSHYTDEHGYFVVNFDDIDETLKEAIEDDK